MSLESDLVLRGPPLEAFPDCSLGEYLVQKMKSLPRDRIIQVDADTGATQTAGEVLAMAAGLSEGLGNLGLKPGDVVMMLCRNRFEATAIVLGSWLSAAVITPLSTTMTVDEIKRVLELTQPKFIFCEEEAAKNAARALELVPLSATVILVEDVEKSQDVRLSFRDVLKQIDVDAYVPQTVESPSTHLATILFSSGTSGLPKGVGIPHASFVCQSVITRSVYGLCENDDFVQTSQFFWVTAHIFLLLSLESGMKRIIMRRPTEINVLKAIDRYKPLWMMCGPSFALSLACHPEFEKFDVSSLKRAVLGGWPLSPGLVEKLKEKLKSVKLYNNYGTTELAGIVCFGDGETDLHSLGKVSFGLQLKVVDVETREPLKANAVGEIVVKSPGRMSCYVKDEKSTREVLDEEGWIRTGDLGFYDESKTVHLVERLKEVVKIDNFQVAPSEVENEILSIPGVLEVGVAGVVRDGDAFELFALVVKERGADVTEEAVRAHVADTLSEHKRLGGGIRFVEFLPRTTTGKLNRKELRKMAQELYSARSE